MELKEELRDYTIALENAARVIHKKSEYKDPKKDAMARMGMDVEVGVIEKINIELKELLRRETKGTYWDYLDDKIA